MKINYKGYDMDGRLVRLEQESYNQKSQKNAKVHKALEQMQKSIAERGITIDLTEMVDLKIRNLGVKRAEVVLNLVSGMFEIMCKKGLISTEEVETLFNDVFYISENFGKTLIEKGSLTIVSK